MNDTDATTRTVPQFFNIYESSWSSSTAVEATWQCEVRLVSRDQDNGSETLMARFPAGWKATVSTSELGFELFVLEGTLALDDQTVGAGGFVAIPRGAGKHVLRSHAGSQAFVFASAKVSGSDYYDGMPHVSEIWSKKWVFADFPGSQHGRMYMPLRVPDPQERGLHGGPGGILHLVFQVPCFHWHKSEFHHNTWEEVICLSGDNLMPGRGAYGPGAYLGNPASFEHGLYMSQRGCLLLRHTDNPVDLEFAPFPRGQEIVQHYLTTRSLIREPEGEKWEDTPEYSFMMDQEEDRAS